MRIRRWIIVIIIIVIRTSIIVKICVQIYYRRQTGYVFIGVSSFVSWIAQELTQSIFTKIRAVEEIVRFWCSSDHITLGIIGFRYGYTVRWAEGYPATVHRYVLSGVSV